MDRRQRIILEAQRKFKLLSEYDFYIPETEKDFDGSGVILGEDEPENDEGLPNDDAADTDGGEMGNAATEDNPDDTDGFEEEPIEDEPIDLSGDDQGGADMGTDAGMDAAPMDAAPAEDEVELDVTQLVQGTEAAKNSSDLANKQIADLLNKFDQLQVKLAGIDKVTAKIDKLEQEVEKRNPTEKEKLEMRSLSSYPYNLKLTDYWADKEGQYDVMGQQQAQKKDKEYVLTQDDVNSFNPHAIKSSFDEDPYEEEDVY